MMDVFYTKTQERFAESHWADNYASNLERQLNYFINYANSHIHKEISQHLPTFLNVLSEAQTYPHLHAKAVELITILHPLPRYSIYGDNWISNIQFAISFFERKQEYKKQALFLAYLIEMYQESGQLDTAKELAERGFILAKKHNAIDTLVNIGEKLITISRAQGETEKAEALHKIIEAELFRSRDRVSFNQWELAWINYRVLNAVRLRGDGKYNKAMQEIESTIHDFSANFIGATETLEFATRIRGLIHWSLGNYQKAIQDYRQCLQLLENSKYIFTRLHVQGILALAYWSISEYDRAESLLKENLATREDLKISWMINREAGNLGLVFLARGQLEQAMVYINRQLALSIKFNDIQEIGRARGNRGIVQMYLGQTEQALNAIKSDMDYRILNNEIRGEISCLLNLSMCYWMMQEKAQAIQAAERANMLANEIDSIVIKALAARILARYQPEDGQAAVLQETLVVMRDRHRRLSEADCLLSLAALAKDNTEQEELWKQGVQILTEIGATAWLKGATPQNPPLLPPTGF
ncbi:MAG: tetratricopeptide repeat protein [Anaerolineae bacterium]|nr:tetratricopeptide repeat protein [Anaerolineae bacterium]